MNELRQWLGGLAPRERNLVYLAAALLAVAIVYLVLVLPVTTAAAKRARARRAEDRGPRVDARRWHRR